MFDYLFLTLFINTMNEDIFSIILFLGLRHNYIITSHISNLTSFWKLLQYLSQLLRRRPPNNLFYIFQSKIIPIGNRFQNPFLQATILFNTYLFLIFHNSNRAKFLMKLTSQILLQNFGKMGGKFIRHDSLHANYVQRIWAVWGDLENKAVVLMPKEKFGARWGFIELMDQNICVVWKDHFFSIFEYTSNNDDILELCGSPDGLHASSAIIGCNILERFDSCWQNWHSVDLTDLLGLVKPASVIHGGKSIISSLQACHISSDCCSFLLRIKMFFHH